MRWRTISALAIGGALVCGSCSMESSPSSSPTAPSHVSAPATSGTLRRITLNDGSRVTVEADDHVVVVSADGRPESESWCGSNGYTRAVRFLTALQDSLRNRDRRAVAELVLYPLRWNGSRHVSIDDRATLLDHYAEIFTPAVVERITRVDARGLFCNSYGFMIGDGLVWGSAGDDGRYGLTTLNA